MTIKSDANDLTRIDFANVIRYDIIQSDWYSKLVCSWSNDIDKVDKYVDVYHIAI